MCVICVKNKGVDLPNIKNIKAMWERNPDGAGYMYVKNERVVIHKGFSTVEDFIKSFYNDVKKDDVAVLHFRISTQANNLLMTHPFALTSKLENMKALDVETTIGVAHNGIIQLTSDHRENEYSDTALFVANYMTRIIRRTSDLQDTYCKSILANLIGWSKLAILDCHGNVTLIGAFEERNGLLYSNLYHENVGWHYYPYGKYNSKNTKRYVKNAKNDLFDDDLL